MDDHGSQTLLAAATTPPPVDDRASEPIPADALLTLTDAGRDMLRYLQRSEAA